MKIDYKLFPIEPSKNTNPDIVYKHFEWRKTNIYIGNSTVQIGDVKEPIWWNRPLNSDTVVKLESDGLYSYNLPYLYRHADFKTGYNILVGKYSIPLIIQIKINQKWTAEQYNKLRLLPIYTTYKALLSLGVDNTKLKIAHNDLLYNGKKFMGSEEAEYGGWYGAAAIITLNYTKEKELFDRLTGKYANTRGICGIIEETNNLFTKEQFITELFKTFNEQLNLL